MVKEAELNRNIDFFCSSAIYNKEVQKQNLDEILGVEGVIKSKLEVFQNPYMPTAGFFFKRSLWESISPFRVDLKTAEDIEFLYRVSERHCIKYISTRLVYVFNQNNSLGSHFDSYLDNIRVIEEFVERNSKPEFIKVGEQMKTALYKACLESILFNRKLTHFPRVAKSALKHTISPSYLILFFKYLILNVIQRK